MWLRLGAMSTRRGGFPLWSVDNALLCAYLFEDIDMAASLFPLSLAELLQHPRAMSLFVAGGIAVAYMSIVRPVEGRYRRIRPVTQLVTYCRNNAVLRRTK